MLLTAVRQWTMLLVVRRNQESITDPACYRLLNQLSLQCVFNIPAFSLPFLDWLCFSYWNTISYWFPIFPRMPFLSLQRTDKKTDSLLDHYGPRSDGCHSQRVVLDFHTWTQNAAYHEAALHSGLMLCCSLQTKFNKSKFAFSVWLSDSLRFLKYLLKLTSIVTGLELSKYDVMLSKLDRLSTGIKMPGTVPTPAFWWMLPSKLIEIKGMDENRAIF